MTKYNADISVTIEADDLNDVHAHLDSALVENSLVEDCYQATFLDYDIQAVKELDEGEE